MPAQRLRISEQAQHETSPVKNHVTSKSPVGDISVVTLIRTDTTLDHSQKAEKVCLVRGDTAIEATAVDMASREQMHSTPRVPRAWRAYCEREHNWEIADGSSQSWQLLESELPHEKFCYG